MIRPYRSAYSLAKIFAAVISALTLSLFFVWYDYVPVSERHTDVYYYGTGYKFTVSLLLHLAQFLILILPLSFLADGLLLSRARAGTTQIIAALITYALVGVAGGLLFSLFTFTLETSGAQIRYMMAGSIVFLFYQTLFLRLGQKRKQEG